MHGVIKSILVGEYKAMKVVFFLSTLPSIAQTENFETSWEGDSKWRSHSPKVGLAYETTAATARGRTRWRAMF
jgi:hypothetical protein